MQPIKYYDVRRNIPELNGNYYKIWKERILLHLGWMDINYAIRKDKPIITTTSTQEENVFYEQWEQSNSFYIMFIKTSIFVGIHGSIEQHIYVWALLKAIDEQFSTLDKALESTLIMKFSSLRLTSVKGVRELIMEMRDKVAQIKTLEVDMSKSFLVHNILNTLPLQYVPFKISYNTHKDKLLINGLLTMCIEEKGRLLMEQGESSMLVTQEKYHNRGMNQSENQANKKGKSKIPPQGGIKKESKCFFCKKKGHVKKDCAKFKKWLEDKGKSISSVCYEYNMVDINTYMVD